MSLIQRNLVLIRKNLVKRFYWVPREQSHLYDHHIHHNYVKQYDPPSKYGYYDMRSTSALAPNIAEVLFMSPHLYSMCVNYCHTRAIYLPVDGCYT